MWSYEPLGVKPSPLQFFSDGTVRNPDWFVGRWEITGLHTVKLTKKEKGKELTTTFTFDPGCTRYEGIGFSQKRTVKGFRKEPVDPATTK